MYGVFVLYNKTQLLAIFPNKYKAEEYRLFVARNKIDNFDDLLDKYVKSWLVYHSIEYPNYPKPSTKLVEEQFLSEQCYLVVDSVSARDITDMQDDEADDQFDTVFYQNLQSACQSY